MLNTRTLIAAAAAAALASSAASAQIFTESFEADPSDASSQYTLTPQFDDGGFDYADQYLADQPETTNNGARDDFSGFDGNGYIGVQDVDNVDDGGNATGTATLSFDTIDITGQSNLSVTGLFAALDSEPDFDNYEAADGDGIEIFASIDGGTATLIGAFAPPAMGGGGTVGAGDLYLDSDLDGIGDGPALSTELASFSFPISGSGSTLDLFFELTSTGSFEPITIDTVSVAVPEPTSLALLGLGGIAALRRRR